MNCNKSFFTGRVPSPQQILVPNQHNLADRMRIIPISRPIEMTQPAAHFGVESASRHVYVLRFNLQMPTTFGPGPIGCGAKQFGPDTLLVMRWTNADIPQNSQIASSFQHFNIWGIPCHGSRADGLFAVSGQPKCPIRYSESVGPMSGLRVELNAIILQIRPIDRPFAQANFTADFLDIKNRANIADQWHLGVFVQPARADLFNGDGHGNRKIIS